MLKFCLSIIFSGVMLTGVCTHHTYAQTKSTKDKKDSAPDTTIIYKTETNEDPPPPEYDYSKDMKETVIRIKKYDTAPKVRPTYKDTVIVIKKGLTKEQLAALKKEKAAELMKKNNYCNCVSMDIKVPEQLEYETYLSYEFVFKNNCQIDVWISSKHFRFTPLTSSGTPVKVIRQLSFVQRYGHPDFVKITPGESYTFNYSDDAFFEYALHKGQSYKFVFEHRNFGDKNKIAPEKTYLCAQKRAQLIFIK